MSLMGALIIALAFVGARHLIPILNPVTLLFREADRPAMFWIQENIPIDATVLINPFAWGYGLYAGNDGGFWITPITGRNTIPPPVLYGLSNAPANIEQINQLSQNVIESSQDIFKLYNLLQAQGIQYVYIGRRGGVLTPKKMQESGLFESLYAENGVWIYKTK
jgi:hypothetical protein